MVSAPAPWQVVRDPDRGCRFLYMEIAKPPAGELNTTVSFAVQRSAVSYELDPAKATLLSDAQIPLFAEELRADAPHMEVTETIKKIARDVCQEEKNPVLKAVSLLTTLPTMQITIPGIQTCRPAALAMRRAAC
jgi:hypothetical protein